jgi:hypothetical protein
MPLQVTSKPYFQFSSSKYSKVADVQISEVKLHHSTCDHKILYPDGSSENDKILIRQFKKYGGAEESQPVQCLATDWMTDHSGSIPGGGKEDLFSRICFQTGSGAHTASCPMGPSPGLKSGRGVRLTTHPHLVLRSRMCRSYISSLPKRLHGVQWDSLLKKIRTWRTTDV